MGLLRKSTMNKIGIGVFVALVLFLFTHSAGTTPHQAKGGAPPGGWVHEGQHDGVAEGAAEAARKAAARKAAKALDTAAAVARPAWNAEAVAEPGGGGVKRVAVLITVTKDMAQMDGAAVLAESARLMNSKYELDMVAIIHPNITTSRSPLEKIGYKLFERNIPVDFESLPEVYKTEVKRAGCCGIYELLKLEALTLTQYDKVLAVDLDTVFLHNIDELFESDKVIQYTEDIGMDMNHFNRVPPAQGGFLLFTPNMQAYNELIVIARKADWRPGGGWEGLRIGYHWGGTTIQGMIPYYFGMKAPLAWRRIVDRCLYNNMADLNCTKMPFEQVKSVHFTLCQKPWSCIHVGDHNHNMDMCRYFHDQWWDIRDKLQQRVGEFEPPTKANRCPRSGYPPLKEFPIGTK